MGNNDKILILGANGQVGGALFCEANRRGLKATGLCTLEPKFDFESWDGKVNSLEDVINEKHPGAVIYAIGMTNVDACEKNRDEAFRWNDEIPTEIAQVCFKKQLLFVYYSTDYIFDGKNGPYTEAAEPNPICVYGASKLAGEIDILQNNPDALILRTTVVYGPERQGKNFAASLRKRISENKSVFVASDQFSNPTFNQDLAKCSFDLLGLQKKGIWNVAGPDCMDRASFAFLIAEVFGLDKKFIIPTATVGLNQAAKRPLKAGFTLDKLDALFGKKYMSSPHDGLLKYKKSENKTS